MHAKPIVSYNDNEMNEYGGNGMEKKVQAKGKEIQAKKVGSSSKGEDEQQGKLAEEMESDEEYADTGDDDGVGPSGHS
ncbi:hypothetical protein ACH5RR_006285 [Cinchona calisaya]|uniref:Uncharacterized protein n=1 Tax=Cinchona calisaya TaxID=153742 RepID=A0ABD3ANL3_9GENT